MKIRMSAVLLLIALTMAPLHAPARHYAPAAPPTQSLVDKTTAANIFDEVVKAPLMLPRNQDDIDTDLENARRLGDAADKRLSAAQAELARVSKLLQMQQGEVTAIKKKIDQVKREKQQADKITLEAEKQRAELIQEFLKKYKELAEASIDSAGSEKDLAQARVAAYQAELETFQKRDARDRAGETESAAASLAFSDAQEQAIRLFKSAADKNKGVAEKLSNIENKRANAAQARAKLVTGGR